jgi:hypothetical protein
VLQVIKFSAKLVLYEKSWLEAPEEVVLKVLQLSSMSIREHFLFSSLVKWGRAQVKNEAEVRAKIDKGLKLIRFCAMDYAEFSQLCCKPIPLTAEEKYKIFLSITQNSSEHLPNGFTNVKNPRCIGKSSIFDWKSVEHTFTSKGKFQTKPVSLTVTVIGSLRYLTGLVLHSLMDSNIGNQVHLTCAVYSLENPILSIVSATFNDIVTEDTSGELHFPWPVLMKKGISYRIELTYQDISNLPHTYDYQIENKSYSWQDESDPKKKVTVLFALGKPGKKRIIDICGLIMAKKIVCI